MKRKNNLLKVNVSYTNLFNIYKEIRKNCRSEKKLFIFNKNLNTNLVDIGNKLLKGTYEFSNYYIFLIREPKYRIIMSEVISDKIINHFMARFILLPALENSFIDANVATRKGKGSKYAYELLKTYLNKIGLNKKIYVLKIDISKYFYSINHNILKEKLSKKIKDKDALDLLYKVIDSTNNDYVNNVINNLKNNEINKVKKMNIKDKEKRISEINNIPLYKKGYGINIGSLTSQTLAIFYLNDLDHFIKEKLKCKYYIRYMDDMIILSDNKIFLQNVFEKIKIEINNLDLKVNPKSRISVFNNGFTFLGFTYRIINNKLKYKTRNITRRKINKKLNKLRQIDYSKYFLSKISYKGYLGLNSVNYEEELIYLKNKYPNYYIFFKTFFKINIINGDKKIIKKILKNNTLTIYNFYLIKKYLNKNKVNYILMKENKFDIYEY